MNSDTRGTGTLPAPRSYMVIGGTLVQVRRAMRVAFGKYQWYIVGSMDTLVAGEQAEYITFTYEQDNALRETFNV